jgi:predicted nucleic acid-binding protein
MAYWDTSCLVKLYAPEPDSVSFKAHIVSGVTVVTSEIARLELWATLRRKEAAGDLYTGGARRALKAFDADVAAGLIVIDVIDPQVVAKFEEVVEQFHGSVPSLPLRTLDAIHLSTAVVSGESEVVATDHRLREAAFRLKFTLYPPP